MIAFKLLLAAAAAPAVYVCNGEPWAVFEANGVLQIGSTEAQSAHLHLSCQVGRGPSSIELKLPPSESFDYENFLGPDAPADWLALSDISWTSNSLRISLTSPATGFLAADSSFVLSTSHASSDLGDLLAAVGAEAGRLVWTQRSYADLNRRFVATFELDANAAASLRSTFEQCALQPVWLPPL